MLLIYGHIRWQGFSCTCPPQKKWQPQVVVSTRATRECDLCLMVWTFALLPGSGVTKEMRAFLKRLKICPLNILANKATDHTS